MRSLRETLPPALAGFAPVTGLAFANGGFFATSWGWWGLAALLLAIVLLAAGPGGLALGPLRAAALGLLAALVAWTALSALWASGATTPLLETERSTLYLALVAAALLVPGRAAPRALAAGVLGACVVVSAWGLAVRLDLREPSGADFESYRIAGPLGYSNGLGLVAAIGILLALGFVLRSPRPDRRALPAAALVPLAAALALTFSRGSWVALIAGLVALVAVERDRLAALPLLAASGLAPALTVLLALRSDALGRPDAAADAVTRAEHRLLVAVLLLGALAVPLVLLAGRVPPPRPGRRARVGAAAALAALALAGAVAGVVRLGGPGDAVHRALAAFRSQDEASGTSHVFSASGSYRSEYWSVAWHEAADEPLLGGGAGSFAARWLRHRPVGFGGLDAHNLYLETLAELGPVGLVLLALALATPLVVLRRSRGAPLAAACAAGYVAFLVHAALDWDWELPAAGLAGVFCGAALLRAEAGSRPLSRAARGVGATAAVALAAFVFVMHVGNVSLAAGETALQHGDVGGAAADARRAQRWQPWSSRAALLLGKAQLAAGDRSAAAASLRIALSRDPGDWEAWRELAFATSGRERVAALLQAARLNPFGA